MPEMSIEFITNKLLKNIKNEPNGFDIIMTKQWLLYYQAGNQLTLNQLNDDVTERPEWFIEEIFRDYESRV